jgi:hypothetical protein
MKLPHGYREATVEERPAFNRANNCVIIRVYDESNGKLKERVCPNRQLPGTAGLCEWCAARFLKPREYEQLQPEAAEAEGGAS